MPTSGSWDYSVTAAQIITAAAEDIGVLDPGRSLSNDDFAVFLRTLNLLVKQWQGTGDRFPGLKAWTRRRLVVPFVASQSRYVIGPGAADDRASAGMVVTKLTAAKASGATTATVSSTSGMLASDQIGFELDSGGIGWTTISSINSSTSLTLASNSVGTASSSRIVYAYTSKAERFVDIEAAMLRDWADPQQPIDILLSIYTDVAQYEELAQKNASGDPTAILVEYLRTNTAITCNFVPASFSKSLRLVVTYPAEDYDSATGADDIAFPQEYFAALEWELARRCAAKFGRPWTPDLQNHWNIAVEKAVFTYPMNSHLYFQPDRW